MAAERDGDERETLTPDGLMDAVGVPPSRRYEVMYTHVTSQLVAIVEAVQAANGGRPIRVSIDRVRAVASDPSAVVRSRIDGDDFLFELMGPDEARAMVEAEQKRIALRRMGPHAN